MLEGGDPRFRSDLRRRHPSALPRAAGSRLTVRSVRIASGPDMGQDRAPSLSQYNPRTSAAPPFSRRPAVSSCAKVRTACAWRTSPRRPACRRRSCTTTSRRARSSCALPSASPRSAGTLPSMRSWTPSPPEPSVSSACCSSPSSRSCRSASSGRCGTRCGAACARTTICARSSSARTARGSPGSWS